MLGDVVADKLQQQIGHVLPVGSGDRLEVIVQLERYVQVHAFCDSFFSLLDLTHLLSSSGLAPIFETSGQDSKIGASPGKPKNSAIQEYEKRLNWFSLERYDKLSQLDALGWYRQIQIRRSFYHRLTVDFPHLSIGRERFPGYAPTQSFISPSSRRTPSLISRRTPNSKSRFRNSGHPFTFS